MMRIDWQLYQVFLAVARDGSLSAAARTLGISQPTLGRQIAELEARLGVALFTRSPKGLAPTPEAEKLLPLAETMAGAADSLLRSAEGDGGAISGTARLSASEVIGAEVLPPILTDFCDRHPGVVIELAVTNHMSDLLRRDADIAVRMVRPTQEALVAKRIGDTRIGLFAHRLYIERHGMPKDAADLPRHRIIGFDRQPPRLPGMPEIDRALFSFRTDADLAGLAALRAGYGIGASQKALARRNPELLPVLPDVLDLALPVWVTMHEDLRRVPLMRVLFDALADGLAAYLA